MGKVEYNCQAREALKKLIEGNKKYVESSKASIDIDKEALLKNYKDRQAPYAIIVTCSDSRVIPEAIFSAELGDLFVIRVDGNVIDSHQLESIVYAEEHFGTGLVVVLGHTHCSAIDAVVSGHSHEYTEYIATDIKKAIGSEKDEYKACIMNVMHCCDVVESSLMIQQDERESGLNVVGAVYDLETGEVEFI
ncbi:carbonic anhydrase [Lachnospiraceae bacterium RM5]|nr:carbonic anhydrase [Lachnospiraceae bacterium RM5]